MATLQGLKPCSSGGQPNVISIYHRAVVCFGGERVQSKPNHVLGDPTVFKTGPARLSGSLSVILAEHTGFEPVLPILAVRQGFEPWVPISKYDGLANHSFRPLRHLTKYFVFRPA